MFVIGDAIRKEIRTTKKTLQGIESILSNRMNRGVEIYRPRQAGLGEVSLHSFGYLSGSYAGACFGTKLEEIVVGQL